MSEPGSSSVSPQMLGKDRISVLPDHLLCKILSFLTVKDASTCSLLSTRWRYILALIPDITLEFTPTGKGEQQFTQISKLISFGNRLFSLRNGTPISKFKISISHCDGLPEEFRSAIESWEFRSAVESWVSAAVSCRVQELAIWFGNLIMEHTIQSTIFTCRTLVSLELRSVDNVQMRGICLPLLKVLRLEVLLEDEDWFPVLIQGCPLLEELDLDVNVKPGIDVSEQLSRSGIFRRERLVALRLLLCCDSPAVLPDSVCLPNLKALFLQNFQLSPYKGDDALRCFINSCPVLEEFHLHGLCFPNYPSGILAIQSSSLKFLYLMTLDIYMDRSYVYTFVIESTSLECLVYSGDGDKNSLIVNAPNLRYFDYTGDLRVQFVQGLELPFSASISVEDDYKPRTELDFPPVQRAFELVTDLQAAKSFCLSDATLEALYHCANPLPAFNNLTSLRLEIRDGTGVSSFQPKCWWKMLPRLFASAPKLQVLVMERVFLDTWIPDEEFDSFESLLLANLPVHFVERLREIEIEGIEPCDDEILAVEYILQKGKALKRFTIGPLPLENLLPESCNRILSLKKCSEDCQIVFKCQMNHSELVASRLESEGVKTFFIAFYH